MRVNVDVVDIQRVINTNTSVDVHVLEAIERLKETVNKQLSESMEGVEYKDVYCVKGFLAGKYVTTIFDYDKYDDALQLYVEMAKCINKYELYQPTIALISVVV